MQVVCIFEKVARLTEIQDWYTMHIVGMNARKPPHDFDASRITSKTQSTPSELMDPHIASQGPLQATRGRSFSTLNFDIPGPILGLALTLTLHKLTHTTYLTSTNTSSPYTRPL